jgi:hypothetical protein
MTHTSTFLLLVAAATMINPIAAQIPNWDIRFSSLETNFDASVKDEILMQYQIGKDRSYMVQLFAKDCLGAIEGTTAIATTTRSSSTTSSNLDDLKVMIDLDKSTITASNFWEDNSLQLCVLLQLLSGDEVIKEDRRKVDIAFDLSIDFELANVATQSASLSSSSGSAHVGKFIKACKCDGLGFVCNTNKLSPNSLMNICIMSIDKDVEISFVDVLQLYQELDTMDIILSASIQNFEISSMTKKNSTAVLVTTVVPSRFFEYGGESVLDVRGTVEMNLIGSRRRSLVAAEDKSPFEIVVELESVDEIDEHGDARSSSLVLKEVVGIMVSVICCVCMMLW